LHGVLVLAIGRPMKEKSKSKNEDKKRKKDKNRNRKKDKGNKVVLTAKSADKLDLYERSVQDPPTDIAFFTKAFRKERKRVANSLREDFCGTAMLCADWVKKHPERTAVGLDLHQPTMDYGWKKHIEPLGKDAERVELLNRDVLVGTNRKFDIIAAFNFSYSVFKTRKQLLSYFQTARRDLVDDGAFFIDLYGGPESQVEVEETQKFKGFSYVWDQKPLDAISAWGLRHIHYRFPDGSEMKKAFTYDWRLWTLPELCDLMDDAGFSSWDVYWEGADKKGSGNGIFKKQATAENEDAWIAYLVGWR